jgi:hypothetical protein
MNSAAATADVFLTVSVLKREKAKPCVLTWKESLREANPLETLATIGNSSLSDSSLVVLYLLEDT